MCTTVLLLGTLVMMLRRRFFNKVEPYHSLGFSLAAAGPRSQRGRASPSLAVQPPAPTPGSA
uniref:Uncharacterized protein n=1 Tax=Aquila chrysaetos chrysaetos TaxID=223781 RepID=A0A663EJ53_AQUCH